jgi:hypothetical protein
MTTMPAARQPDATALGLYVGLTDAQAAGDGAPYLAECLTEAAGMVVAHEAGHSADVPDHAHYRAVLEVAAELHYRRQARGGIAMFTTGENPAPVRLARDPLTAAYPILAPYLPGGFA